MRMNKYGITGTQIRKVLKLKQTISALLPEKSISGNIASSGIFVNAVQTFSSNNFNTVKEQKLIYFFTKNSSTLR